MYIIHLVVSFKLQHAQIGNQELWPTNILMLFCLAWTSVQSIEKLIAVVWFESYFYVS